MHSYALIRTHRKTLALQIKNNEVLVRAPMRLSQKYIDRFVQSKQSWIEKHLSHSSFPEETEEKIRTMQDGLSVYISDRVFLCAKGKNLPHIQGIRVTLAKRQWGSCSTRNTLNFSYRLAYFLDTPEGREAIDAVVSHELAHLREKNHQKPFWNLVISWMPEYREAIKRLENYGSIV